MTVFVKSEQAARGPHGLAWDAPGAVVPVDDHQVARELCWQPGFTEVDPVTAGRHEKPDTEPEPEPEGEADGDGEKKPASRRKTPVAE